MIHPTSKREKFWFALSVVLTLMLFIGGQGLPDGIARDKEDNAGLFEELKTFTDVLALVQRDYVRDVTDEELVKGAIRGMLKSLDPHSGYLDPDFYNDLQVQTKGEFGGLGIEITIRDGLLMVVAPMEGSPAEQAGIQPGDAIVKIEGTFTKDFSLVEAVKKLRGPKGSKIKISVHREGVAELMDVEIVRDIIAVKSVRGRLLKDGLVYLRLNQFVETSTQDLVEMLRDLSSRLPKGTINGLVLDMRNNPGGLLTQAVGVSNLFLDEGVIVYTDGRVETQKQKFFASEQGTQPQYPIVVLINGGSASASEIVAGSLQDHGRALVLGTKSFGKGSVQTITPLNNGGALTLTTALYYTKSGRSINEVGIEPDVTVELPKEPPLVGDDEEEDQAEALIRPEDLPLDKFLERDPQLSSAFELLESFARLGSSEFLEAAKRKMPTEQHG